MAWTCKAHRVSLLMVALRSVLVLCHTTVQALVDPCSGTTQYKSPDHRMAELEVRQRGIVPSRYARVAALAAVPFLRRDSLSSA